MFHRLRAAAFSKAGAEKLLTSDDLRPRTDPEPWSVSFNCVKDHFKEGELGRDLITQYAYRGGVDYSQLMKRNTQYRQIRSETLKKHIYFILEIDKPEMPMGRQIAIFVIVLVAPIPYLFISSNTFHMYLFFIIAVPAIIYRSLFNMAGYHYQELLTKWERDGLYFIGWEIVPKGSLSTGFK